MFKSYNGFFSPLLSIGNWFLVKGAKYINDLSPNVFENFSLHIMCKGQCVKCKLFPEDRFNMKCYTGYFKFDRNFFLSRKSLVYYVELMAMCLANTKYFSILRVFG